jgi:hypothetical protein
VTDCLQWSPKEFQRIKAQRASEKLDDDAWYEELLKELRDSGVEFEAGNPTETAVKNMQTTNTRLKNLVSTLINTYLLHALTNPS